MRLLAMSYGALHCAVKLTHTAATYPRADGAAGAAAVVAAVASLGAALYFRAQADLAGQLRAGAFHKAWATGCQTTAMWEEVVAALSAMASSSIVRKRRSRV